MRPNKLRELLKANKPTLSTHIHTTWPSVVEAIGHTGLYDYVEFVGEYGPFDLHDLDNLARPGDIYNMSMQLKVDQEPRGFLAQRAIGSGFHSILFADCRSADDVQECVRIVRAETPEDKGTYGVATRRFTYMGYGGTKEYVQALSSTSGPRVSNETLWLRYVTAARPTTGQPTGGSIGRCRRRTILRSSDPLSST